MPPEFELEPADKMGGRVSTLRKLIKSKDVSEIINACDAGREGELIFRYIVQYAGTKKAYQASVAAIDDVRGHPRRVRATA
jgi:Topoisomerase IA